MFTQNNRESSHTDTLTQPGSREGQKYAHEILLQGISPQLYPIAESQEKKSNKAVKIVSLETLRHLGPLMTQLIKEKGPRDNIASLYYALATDINRLLKLHSFRIPDTLVGLSSRYSLVIPYSGLTVAATLGEIFGGVSFVTEAVSMPTIVPRGFIHKTSSKSRDPIPVKPTLHTGDRPITEPITFMSFFQQRVNRIHNISVQNQLREMTPNIGAMVTIDNGVVSLKLARETIPQRFSENLQQIVTDILEDFNTEQQKSTQK